MIFVHFSSSPYRTAANNLSTMPLMYSMLRIWLRALIQFRRKNLWLSGCRCAPFSKRRPRCLWLWFRLRNKGFSVDGLIQLLVLVGESSGDGFWLLGLSKHGVTAAIQNAHWMWPLRMEEWSKLAEPYVSRAKLFRRSSIHLTDCCILWGE